MEVEDFCFVRIKKVRIIVGFWEWGKDFVGSVGVSVVLFSVRVSVRVFVVTGSWA